MPNTCHLRGHTDAHGQLDPTLGAQGNTCRRKIFLQSPKPHAHLRISAPFPPIQSQTPSRSFYFFFNKQRPPVGPPHPRPCYPGDRGRQMATAVQSPATPTTDSVQHWLARRGACPQLDAEKMGLPAPSLEATSSEAQRVRRAPQNRPGTCPRRAPFCASSSKVIRASAQTSRSSRQSALYAMHSEWQGCRRVPTRWSHTGGLCACT